MSGLVTQSVASLIADPGVMSLIPACSHTIMEIDRGIFSMVIHLLPLIQEGLLSVTSKSMCMEYLLVAQSKLYRKRVVRLSDMTIAVDWDIEP